MKYIIDAGFLVKEENLKLIFTKDHEFYFEGPIKSNDLTKKQLMSSARAKVIPPMNDNWINYMVLKELGILKPYEDLQMFTPNTFVRLSSQEVARDKKMNINSILVDELKKLSSYSEELHIKFNYKRNWFRFINIHLVHFLKNLPLIIAFLIMINILTKGVVISLITYWSIIPIVLSVSMIAFMLKCRLPIIYSLMEVLIGFGFAFIVYNYYHSASYQELGRILSILSGVIIVSRGLSNFDSNIHLIRSQYIKRNWRRIFYGSWT